MKKLIMLLTVALLFTVYAGTTPFLSADSGNDAMTAHWQAYAEGSEDTAACVIDDGDEYSLGDCTWMYNADELDFTDAVTGYLCFNYMLDVADSNDFMAVYVVEYEPVAGDFDPDVETPLAVYDSNAGDWTEETIDLAGFCGADVIYVVFYWESDASGVAGGVRLNDAQLCYLDGETYEWTQLLRWDEDHDDYGPGEAVNLDLSAGAGSIIAVDFHYDDGGWDWWAEVDQVVVSDDSRADLLTEDFESWPPTDWTIEDYETYGWCSNTTTGRSNYAGGDGNCAIADSDYWYPINSHLITPSIDCSDSGSVDLDFVASYNDISGGSGDYFEVSLGVAEEMMEMDEAFDDLGAWTTVDEGEYASVIPTSWGDIKATFE